MATEQIKVPDIGDFDEVDVIEVLVAEGDTVEAEQSLITLESDKATMEVPAPKAGKVLKVLIREGDKVAEGTPILELEPAEAGAGRETAAPASEPEQAPALAEGKPSPAAATEAPSDADCDLVVIGAGPGGYNAAFRAADLGLKVILVERYPVLGGVCLNVGCIPSKALLHVSHIIEAAEQFTDHGVAFGKPKIELDKLRDWKDSVVQKLTGGLAGMAKQRKVKPLPAWRASAGPTRSPWRAAMENGRSASGKPLSLPAPARSPHRGWIWTIRGSWIQPVRWNCTISPSACWWSAAASSAWKWPRSMPRSVRRSPWWN
jgi:dihydrolipoamide dehydrogenase